MTLHELCNKYKVGDWPDKGSTHSYLDVYAEKLAPYRETAKNILEIGLMSGESLRMWEEYFTGTVYGMDCDITPIGGIADLRPIMAEQTHNILIGDAADADTVRDYFAQIRFDVVIEDAGHGIAQQLEIYNVFKPYLSAGAIYIIEDVQDIDASRELLQNIDPEKTVEIIDLRKVKNRYDDVLIIIK